MKKNWSSSNHRDRKLLYKNVRLEKREAKGKNWRGEKLGFSTEITLRNLQGEQNHE